MLEKMEEDLTRREQTLLRGKNMAAKIEEKPAEYMTYPEYLENIKNGIVTENGHCPVTPLLVMLQGRWKSQLMYEMCIYDTVRFGQLKKDLDS